MLKNNIYHQFKHVFRCYPSNPSPIHAPFGPALMYIFGKLYNTAMWMGVGVGVWQDVNTRITLSLSGIVFLKFFFFLKNDVTMLNQHNIIK